MNVVLRLGALLLLAAACTRTDVPPPRDVGPHDQSEPSTNPQQGVNTVNAYGTPIAEEIKGSIIRATNGVVTPTSYFPLRASPIAAENNKPGDSDWQLSNYNPNLAGFTDQTSYLPGETVKVHVGFSNAITATWSLYRLGYYGGKLARKVMSGGPVNIAAATQPVIDPATGAVHVNWPAPLSFTLPDDAVTGIYLLKFNTAQGDSRTIFVVREKTNAAVVLMPLAINTYHAYDTWGGTSLYENKRSDWSKSHAFAVSFDRPFQSGNGVGLFDMKDRGFITFAEAQGFDIAYATDVELDSDVDLLPGRRLVVIQGHSEYWTKGMRDAVEAAVDRGTNVVFFGANNAYWQVRYGTGPQGERQLVGYKDFAASDPIAATNASLVTAKFRDAVLGRPENALIGSMFGDWIWTSAPLIVKDASHWIWTGAGVSNGTLIAGVYGDETDRRYDNGAEPSGVQVLAEGVVESYGGQLSHGQTTIYNAPTGATVFNASSIAWSRALSAGGFWDPRIQQVVANLFSKFAGTGQLGASILKPVVMPPRAVPNSYVSGVNVSTVATGLTQPTAIAMRSDGYAVIADGNRIVSVSPAGQVTLIAGDAEEGLVDGTVSEARFRSPRGIAVAPNGTIYVADTQNHRIRKIAGGQVSTLAGAWDGFADGSASVARFTQPMGISLAPGGTSLLVADTWTQRIRQVQLDGTTTTLAGNGQLGVIEGAGSSASLSFPLAVSPTADGQYAILAEPATGLIRKVALAGTHNVSVVAGVRYAEGWEDGPLSSATVNETWNVTAAPNGDIILLDSATARIRRIHAGTVQTLAGGTRGDLFDGPGATAGFSAPRAAAFAPDGSLWVVDAALGAVRKLSGF